MKVTHSESSLSGKIVSLGLPVKPLQDMGESSRQPDRDVPKDQADPRDPA
jgi:hypothetical protein